LSSCQDDRLVFLKFFQYFRFNIPANLVIIDCHILTARKNKKRLHWMNKISPNIQTNLTITSIAGVTERYFSHLFLRGHPLLCVITMYMCLRRLGRKAGVHRNRAGYLHSGNGTGN